MKMLVNRGRNLMFILAFTLTGAYQILTQSYMWRPSFDLYDTNLFDLMKVKSLAHCAVQCMIKTECFSFYYKEADKSCKLKSEIFWKSTTNMVTEWKYYERSFENAAVSKLAFQVSTHANISGHDASHAVDGILLDQMYGLGCSTTSYEVSPWLIVNLNRIYEVDFVVIFNRRDENGDRLHNIEVRLGLTRSNFEKLCGSYEGPAKDGQVVYIGCQTGSSGQFVRIQIVGSDGIADNVLTMCEAEVHVK